MDTRKAMEIIKVEENDEQFIVQTTGAKFVIHKNDDVGIIECWQMLNKERKIGEIKLGNKSIGKTPFKELYIGWEDKKKCILNVMSGSASTKIFISADSLITFTSNQELTLEANIDLGYDYLAEKNGNIIVADEIGGIGIYPYKNQIERKLTMYGKDKINLKYSFLEEARIYVSVFPPRPFNLEQYKNDNIYHISHFPTDEELDEVSQYNSVLVLHETIWKGRRTKKGLTIDNRKDLYEDASWCCYEYESADEELFKHVIKKAHGVGMRVIVYMSPYYSMSREMDYLNNVKRVMNDYGIDGIYFDGNSMDVKESYDIIRNVRDIVGDGIIYVHCTSDPISKEVFCPFIDTYADYILKAEHIIGMNDSYLKNVVSGRNRGNCIGFLCSFNEHEIDDARKLLPKCIDYKIKWYMPKIGGKYADLYVNEYIPMHNEE